MHTYPNEKIALFIDGANLFSTARALSFDIDFNTVLKYFRQRAQLIRALYYTTVDEDVEVCTIRPLIDWLDYNGYTMVTKPTKEFTDAAGNRRIKGNMDIELAVDMMRLAPSLDHIFLFSGDSKFCALVAYVQEMGKRVSVVSTLATDPPMIGSDLRRQADQFVDLADLEAIVCRKSTKRPLENSDA